MTNSQCVPAAVFILHAKSMRRIILSSVACLAVPYFSPFSYKEHNLKKKKTYRISHVCYEILTTFFLVLRIIQRDINIRRSPCIASVILSIF